MAPFQALILSLPARNSTARMRVWRALKDNGCGVLRDGVYLLPAGAPSLPALGQLEADIRAEGGFAMTVELNLRNSAYFEQVRKLFDRGAHYAELVKSIAEARARLPQLGPRKAQTLVQRLRRAHDKVAQSDFFPGPARAQAAESLAGLERRAQELYCAGEPRAARKRIRRLAPAKYKNRLWVTRRDLWVDRLASAWLIRRHIDREARFVWIEKPRERPRKALGFDYDGAQFTHSGGKVTFEVLAASFGLEHDPAIGAIGAAVRFLDVGGIPSQDARGLETLLRGAKEKVRGDDELLAEAMRIFDWLYAAYGKERTTPS